MTSTIYGFIDYSSKIKVYDIYGYATNGIPGIELILPAKVAKQFQQKLIFLTRKNKLQIPMKRFVLGVDADFDSSHSNAIKQLELPFLILFWSMANIIKLPKTENCLTSGEFGINGKIKFNQNYRSWFSAVDQVSEEYFGDDLTLIGEWPRASELPYAKISIQDLFEGIKSIGSEPALGKGLRNQACLPETDQEE
jgi:hypothetical protein